MGVCTPVSGSLMCSTSAEIFFSFYPLEYNFTLEIICTFSRKQILNYNLICSSVVIYTPNKSTFQHKKTRIGRNWILMRVQFEHTSKWNTPSWKSLASHWSNRCYVCFCLLPGKGENMGGECRGRWQHIIRAWIYWSSAHHINGSNNKSPKMAFIVTRTARNDCCMRSLLVSKKGIVLSW